jgi:hypothetical protein
LKHSRARKEAEKYIKIGWVVPLIAYLYGGFEASPSGETLQVAGSSEREERGIWREGEREEIYKIISM